MVKVIADGIDPYSPGSTSSDVCLPEGFPLPGTSSQAGFEILIPETLAGYPDSYGPSSSAGGLVAVYGWVMMLVSGFIGFML